MAADAGGKQDRSKSDATRRRDAGDDDARLGFFARIMRFIREIVAEMKKVRYPSKTELWTYFLVVVFFVAALMLFTGLADFIFGRLTTLVFA